MSLRNVSPSQAFGSTFRAPPEPVADDHQAFERRLPEVLGRPRFLVEPSLFDLGKLLQHFAEDAPKRGVALKLSMLAGYQHGRVARAVGFVGHRPSKKRSKGEGRGNRPWRNPAFGSYPSRASSI